jgi:hypothetical protein
MSDEQPHNERPDGFDALELRINIIPPENWELDPDLADTVRKIESVFQFFRDCAGGQWPPGVLMAATNSLRGVRMHRRSGVRGGVFLGVGGSAGVCASATPFHIGRNYEGTICAVAPGPGEVGYRYPFLTRVEAEPFAAALNRAFAMGRKCGAAIGSGTGVSPVISKLKKGSKR